jgi:PhnB protein
MKENNATTVRPFLTVNDAKKAIDFYIAAFGAIELARYGKTDEKLSAKISVEEAEFFVGGEEPEYGNVSPGAGPNSSVRIILQSKNADAIFEKSLAFGATQICPMTTEDVWRIGKLKDPFGHVWEIGYILKD